MMDRLRGLLSKDFVQPLAGVSYYRLKVPSVFHPRRCRLAEHTAESILSILLAHSIPWLIADEVFDDTAPIKRISDSRWEISEVEASVLLNRYLGYGGWLLYSAPDPKWEIENVDLFRLEPLQLVQIAQEARCASLLAAWWDNTEWRLVTTV
jgi:hypothetical protein